MKFVTRDNKERCGRIASESIQKSFYTNLLKSVITTEAVNLAKEITDVMQLGGLG